MALTVPPQQAAERHCQRCGTWYTAEEMASGQAWELKSRVDASTRSWAPVCKPCTDEIKDARKGVDRWPDKISGTTTRHAVRLRIPKDLGNGQQSWHDPGLTAKQLTSRYGWYKRQMTHDAKFQYGNGCSYCHCQYSEMGHGHADITLDIFDPRLPPDYATNTRWCCMTCQRRKGLLTPEKWAIKQWIFRKWDTAKSLTAEARGMLF